jgi:A/G-specific adenine glycosylase
MLQQTQVDTVIPYYNRWMKQFPTVQKLAQASIHQVLKLWEGLGYYSRARNFHKGAQTVVQQFKGKVPSTSKELLHLPGIGPYTASAIASIAFNEDTPVVDGNVHRVLSRLFVIKNDLKKIHKKAQDLLFKGKAHAFNQALMELGATLCTPRKPSCLICPMRKFCMAYARGIQEKIPMPAKRFAQPKVKKVTGLIWQGRKILIYQRPLIGLLGGLWEFPSVRLLENQTPAVALKRFVQKTVKITIRLGHCFGNYQHTYTHFKEYLEVFEAHWQKGKISELQREHWKWILPEELNKFAFTGISGKIRRDLLSALHPLSQEILYPTQTKRNQVASAFYSNSKGAVLTTSDRT